MKYFRLHIDDRNIATLIFDTPNSKANTFTSFSMKALEQQIHALQNNLHIKALFIESAKEDIFIAGADIHEIKKAKTEKEIIKFVQQGQKLFTKISLLPFPTIAIIDGACLGGGLELALACTYRISSNHTHTRLGLPEVNLGIIPGFGGTQRLPLLVGYSKAMELMVAGKHLKSDKALKLGLVDSSVPQGYLAFKKEEFIQAILNKTLESSILKKRHTSKWYEHCSLIRKIISQLAKREVLKKTKGHYPAPLQLIDLMQNTYSKSIEQGLKVESKTIAELLQTDVSKNLIELFLISEELKHENFVGKNAKSVKIKQSAVVGTGVMGSGIAWALNNLDINVRLKVRSSSSATQSIVKIRKIYEKIKKRRRLTEREIRLKMDRVTFTSENEGFKNCDFLIEAVNEDTLLKQKIYQEFETILPSISISTLAKHLKYPNRFIGMHFFNPVDKMPLVEIIAGEKTDDKTIATVVELSKKMGKTPIKVKESAGFLVNRILLPYLGEATLLFEQGGEIELIDKTLLNFGMPMGPLTLIDQVGVDIGEKVSNILHQAYGERIPNSPLLTEMINKGWLGKKSGQGFYDYKNKTINYTLIAQRKSHDFFEPQTILEHCILIMINEASRCLEESVVKNAQYLDMAMILGTGFPPFRGGLLKYADNIGINHIILKLEALEQNYGKRFEPSKLLQKMDKKNQTFYGKI